MRLASFAVLLFFLVASAGDWPAPGAQARTLTIVFGVERIESHDDCGGGSDWRVAK